MSLFSTREDRQPALVACRHHPRRLCIIGLWRIPTPCRLTDIPQTSVSQQEYWPPHVHHFSLPGVSAGYTRRGKGPQALCSRPRINSITTVPKASDVCAEGRCHPTQAGKLWQAQERIVLRAHPRLPRQQCWEHRCYRRYYPGRSGPG